ncbi:MAG: L-aspartate oxidase [Candidatus Poribacteria bacterium]|nr:L-aspartate oxidase [Candidatus Poribacteria bacterium]
MGDSTPNPTPTSTHPRYLLPFDTADLPRRETDFLIIGSGNAGLRAAIELADHGRVTILCKESVEEGSTKYAQGGIAVALSDDDRVDYHVQDTLVAGVGLCDETAVRFMVERGIERVKELLDWGAQFDKIGDQLQFGMEGAHRVRRVVHRGDATGEETLNVLVRRALEHPNVAVMEHTFAVDALTHEGVCCGALVLTSENALEAVFARSTVLASGGLGQLYGYTSNPAVTTGDGIALAFRAGASLVDLEFIQFHPTTLFLQGAPRFLISEAVRGEGGILVNGFGERFMIEYHEREELAPRDVVSRAILTEMERTGLPYVYLDVTHHHSDYLKERFPTIHRTCEEYGVEIWRDAIPVQPAAHFMMGGVYTDLNAETTLPGMFACGEVACTLVHGANRLASNSLLEGLVFGEQTRKSAIAHAESIPPTALGEIRVQSTDALPTLADDPLALRKALTEVMWGEVGVWRDGESLQTALAALEQLPVAATTTRAGLEYGNMRLLGELVTRAALAREESRGAHYREDFPETSDRWKVHLYYERDEHGTVLQTERAGGIEATDA